MTAEILFFTLFALGSLGGALGVVLVRNPVNAAMSLVASFFFLAAIYILLQAQFLAVLQVLVYAGAIMVLFLFVLMLLNQRGDELGKARVQVTRVIGVVAAAGVFTVLASSIVAFGGGAAQVVGESVPETWGTVRPIGLSLMTEHVLAFELVAVLLLVGIVSSVVIAKRRI
jgi:NADH-quinone oxidoreductase subunit J